MQYNMRATMASKSLFETRTQTYLIEVMDIVTEKYENLNEQDM